MLVIVWHEYSMLDLIFNKDGSFFFGKKLVSSRGAPQEIDAKFRFAINPQRSRQLHDIGASLGIARFLGDELQIWIWNPILEMLPMGHLCDIINNIKHSRQMSLKLMTS